MSESITPTPRGWHPSVNGSYPTQQPETEPDPGPFSSPQRQRPVAGAAPPEAEAGPEPQVPPRDGEVADAPAADGGGSPPGATPDESPLHHPADGPAVPAERLRLPHAGEDLDAPAPEEPEYKIRDWIRDHFDAVYDLVQARQAPVAAPEPEPEPVPPQPEEPLPVPYVAPGDRWTKWKMSEFRRQLAATHSVTAAAKAVKMSRNSAYKLRARLKGQPFDVAWEAAFRHGYDELAMAALELALEGEEVPHYYQGEVTATHRRRYPQLMVQLLKMRNRDGRPMLGRYNAAAEFWTEQWDPMLERVETGAVDWSDERKALTAEELEKLDLPTEERDMDNLIERNLPDDPKGRFGR